MTDLPSLQFLINNFMETILNIYLFPYTAVVFIFKYALAGLGWFGLFVLCHNIITQKITDWRFRNPFYRD